MNADIGKIRDSVFFRPLPERAFDRTLPHLQVRAYQKGDTILDLSKDKKFGEYVGYVVSGRALFLADNIKPVGVAFKDEFFLGRPFRIEDDTVRQLISAHDATLVVFIPKMVINSLISASSIYSDLVEQIYDSIFERAKLISADKTAQTKVQDWMQNDHANKTLSSWIGAIEKRRLNSLQAAEKKQKERRRTRFMWALVWLSVIVLTVECLGRLYQWPFLFSNFFGLGGRGIYETGSDFNVGIGIVGYIFVLLTSAHYFVKLGIRKFKWKINYKLSGQLHILFGALGLIYIFFHVGFDYVGLNVAHFAFYALVIGAFSGVIGQTISNQIPKTIRGDKVKLDTLKSEQQKIQQKAEILMEGKDLHKTAVHFLSQGIPKSFWANIFAAPRLWWRTRSLKKTFKSLGMGGRSASQAASLLAREFKLNQRIRMLELSNVFFKRWMLIHKPLGYLVYFLALVHVVLVTFLA